MNGVELEESRRIARSLRYGVAALALVVGFAATPAHGVAFAEPGSAATSSATAAADKTVSTGETANDGEPSGSVAGADDQDGPSDTETPGADPDPDAGIDDPSDPADTADPLADVPGEPEPTLEEVPEPKQPTESAPDAPTTSDGPVVQADSVTGNGGVTAEASHDERTVGGPATPLTSGTGLLTLEVTQARPALAPPLVTERTATATSTLAAVTSTKPAEITTPVAPQPLSPLGELLLLPGRLINVVLQFFDITTSADNPGSPFNFAPINDLLFAAFREVERLIGLDRTPPPQPAVPTLIYTGPTTRLTPTVAQFLNAAAAGYGLGTTPGGLVPFTVNGFQMSSMNVSTGQVANTWVTPEGQIIIAYQGTTGGTNLLLNPFVAISQVLTDIQIIFTRTTPLAFYDALRFAQRVQAAAAKQGFDTDDLFVTGHSLGGWEAQYVSQQIGLAGIGFESPGINTVVPGNGADSMFVNIETYGDPAPFMATDLPGVQPFMPPYVPAGGSKPHYGSIVMIGDPAAMTPLYNASALWGKGLIGAFVFLVDFLGNFFQYHLPGVQAYHLDVANDPGMVPWLGTSRGPVHTGYGTLTIPELMKAASDDGILFRP